MQITHKPIGAVDLPIPAAADAQRAIRGAGADWPIVDTPPHIKEAFAATSLRPVSAPLVAIDADVVSGAESFATQLDAAGSISGEGAENLMAAFLKLQIFGDEVGRDYMHNLIEAASVLSQLAIANARKMTHTAQQAGSYGTMLYLMVVYSVLDQQMSRMIEDKQVKQQKETKKRLEGQMDGEEEKDVDPEKREGKFKRRSGLKTAIGGETSDFSPGTLWSLVHEDRRNVSAAIRSLTGNSGDLAAARASTF